jgi:hypothetical protein
MLPENPDGTDALQDGWVTPSKTPRKSAAQTSPHTPDPKTDSDTWDKVQDGWDKHK